jgi:hypothetical protein
MCSPAPLTSVVPAELGPSLQNRQSWLNRSTAEKADGPGQNTRLPVSFPHQAAPWPLQFLWPMPPSAPVAGEDWDHFEIDLLRPDRFIRD